MYTLHDVGDQALLVEFENEISMEVNRKVVALKRALEERRLPGIGELIPTYRSLVIHYDPLTADLDQLKEAIDQGVKHLDLSSLPKVPLSPRSLSSTKANMPWIWRRSPVSRARPRKRSSASTVRAIIMCICWALRPATPTPPALRIPSPSSGGRPPGYAFPAAASWCQLGLSDIIPFDQPCGWNIIGTTPILACDYRKKNPFLLKAGQWIRHVPVDKAEFMDIKRQVELGCYQPKTYEKEG